MSDPILAGQQPGTRTIVVALPDALDWANGLKGGPDDFRVITSGTVTVRDVAHWYGLPAPADDMVWVNLQAPELVESDDTERWLEFRPGEYHGVEEPFCCWTSDLVAIKFR